MYTKSTEYNRKRSKYSDDTNFAFNPDTLTVEVGTTVTWINRETDHDVVSDTGEFTSPILANGENFTHTFTQAGEYPYHCGLHPSMTGKIIVQN